MSLQTRGWAEGFRINIVYNGQNLLKDRVEKSI